MGKVGEILEVESPIVDGKILRTFIRGRVLIDLQKPLPTGCWVPKTNQPHSWVSYKYERLQAFCIKCGIIGHEQKDCSKELAMAANNPNTPKYNPSLSVHAPKTLSFLRKDHGKREPRPQSPMAPKPREHHTLRLHNQTISPNQPQMSSETHNPTPSQTNNSPSFSSTPWEVQTMTTKPLLEGTLKTFFLESPNQKGGVYNHNLPKVQIGFIATPNIDLISSPSQINPHHAQTEKTPDQIISPSSHPNTQTGTQQTIKNTPYPQNQTNTTPKLCCYPSSGEDIGLNSSKLLLHGEWREK